MDDRNFREILDEKLLKSEPKQGASQQNSTAEPAGLAFLLGQIPSRRFVAGQYPRRSTPPRPQNPIQLKAGPGSRKRGPNHKLDEIQCQAVAYLRLLGCPLEDDFTPEELKRAFRKAALIAHPDRGGSSFHFVKLKKSYESLNRLFKKAEPQ